MLSRDRKSPTRQPTVKWETRLAEFPTVVADPMVGIFLSSLKISDRFLFSLTIKKTVPSSLVADTKVQEQNAKKKKKKKKKKNQQIQSILLPNVPFISTKKMDTHT